MEVTETGVRDHSRLLQVEALRNRRMLPWLRTFWLSSIHVHAPDVAGHQWRGARRVRRCHGMKDLLGSEDSHGTGRLAWTRVEDNFFSTNPVVFRFHLRNLPRRYGQLGAWGIGRSMLVLCVGLLKGLRPQPMPVITSVTHISHISNAFPAQHRQP